MVTDSSILQTFFGICLDLKSKTSEVQTEFQDENKC